MPFAAPEENFDFNCMSKAAFGFPEKPFRDRPSRICLLVGDALNRMVGSPAIKH